MDVRGEGKGWVNMRGARTPGHQHGIAHMLLLREQEKLWAGLAWETVPAAANCASPCLAEGPRDR